MIDLGIDNPTNSNIKVITAREGQTQDLKIQRSQTTPEKSSTKSIFVERQKKSQPYSLFFLNLIAIMLLSFFNFVIFIAQDMIVVASIIGFVFIFSVVISLTNSCVLTVTIKDMCALYFLLDSICVALCTCVIGMIGMIILVNPPAYVSTPFGALNLAFFCFAGDQRVIIANVKYQRWQTILAKLAIFIGLLGYLALAAYLLIINFATILIAQGKLDTFEDFFFLYIFGMFTLHMEIFTKISDLDGTGDCQYHYRIDEEDQFMKMKLYRKGYEEENTSAIKRGVEIEFLSLENDQFK